MTESTDSEAWRPIPGYEGLYQVSSLGRILSMPRQGARGGLKSIRIDKDGYPYANLHKENRGRTFKVHRLVALAFLGPRPPGMETRHLDGNPTNNRVENLTYGTRSENNYDRVRHGTDHNASKTECAHGHPYDEANTRVYRGRRYCLACEIPRGKRNPDRDWTRCPQGHPFDEANTYRDKLGKRSCRACARERSRRRYWAKKKPGFDPAWEVET